MRRLREALVKLVSVVGVPKPIEAVFSMGEVEREEDKDYSFSRYLSPVCSSTFVCMMLDINACLRYREHWKSGEENQKRGRDWLGTIYRHNDNKTADMMAAHKDISKSLPLSSC